MDDEFFNIWLKKLTGNILNKNMKFEFFIILLEERSLIYKKGRFNAIGDILNKFLTGFDTFTSLLEDERGTTRARAGVGACYCNLCKLSQN